MVVVIGGDGSEIMTPLPLVVKACTEVQPMMAITDTTDSDSSLDTLFFVGIMAVQIDCIVWLSLYCNRLP